MKKFTADFLFDMALDAEIEEDLENAMVLYRACINTDNNYQEAWINLGRLYVEKNHPRRAIKCFLRANRINGNNPVCWFNLGTTYHDISYYRQAEFAYRVCLKLDPNFYDCQFNYEQLKQSL